MRPNTDTIDKPAGISITCETCHNHINKKDAVFRCVSCESVMHMTPQCTKFSNEVINAIQQVNLNVLLICNLCVSQNKRDVVIDLLKEKPEKVVQIQDTLKTVIKDTMDTKLNEIEKTNEQHKREIVKAKVENKPEKVNSSNTDLNVLVRGIDESKDKDLRIRIEKDRQEVKTVLQFLALNDTINDCKRVGKYTPDKHRPLLVTMPSAFDKRLLLSSLARLKNYDKKVYISRELSPEERQLQNRALKARRIMIDKGIPRKDIKVNECKLYQRDDNIEDNWNEVKIDTLF